MEIYRTKKFNMKFAPVIIPTLDRVEKLKNCLESLEQCIGASETDVFISVDYPPSNHYISGWLKVSEYLDYKYKNHTFRNLIIIKREKNLGIGNINSNSNVTLNELRIKYDRYIFTEDDNLFSKNFLLYMNKGLEKFKDDKRIFMLSGYNYQSTFPEMYKNNFYITQNGSPWGMGGWFDRLDELRKYQDLNFLRSLLLDKSKYRILKHRRKISISRILSMLKVGHYFGDCCYGCYAAMEDKYWVLPVVSKVRNDGFDGSGYHCNANKYEKEFFDSQLIDEENTFEFTDDIFTYQPLRAVFVESPDKWYKEMAKSIITKIDLICLRIFGFVPKSKYI